MGAPADDRGALSYLRPPWAGHSRHRSLYPPARLAGILRAAVRNALAFGSGAAPTLGLAAAVGLLSAGCASYPRMTRPPVAPPASAVYMPGAGGEQLYTAIEGSPEPRGVVWYVVGPEIGSAPLYPGFTKALHQAGFATAVLHPRGAGYSTGVRGDIEDYALFLGDYEAFLLRLRERFAGRPLFLLGHSAGAAFALHLAANSRAALAGVVLVNPAYKLIYSEGMGPSFGDYVVYGANYVFRPAALTVDMNSDPSAVKNDLDRAEGMAMQRDPLVVRHFSMRYLFAQRKVMDRCAENIAAMVAPLLLVQGAGDALVDPKGNDELLAAARSTDKRKLVAPGAGHGSSAVESMIAPLLDWLSERAPAPGEAPPAEASAAAARSNHVAAPQAGGDAGDADMPF